MALVLFLSKPPDTFSPEFNPELNGLDDTVPSQMVPDKGSRFIAPYVIGAGTWTIESLNPHIASVSPADKTGDDPTLRGVYGIDGLHHGKLFSWCEARVSAEPRAWSWAVWASRSSG